MKLTDLFAKNRNPQSRFEDGIVAKEVVRAAGIDPAEAEVIADDAALYRRVRSKIHAVADEGPLNPWLEIILASRKAAPAMVVVGALAVGGLLYSIEQNRTSPPRGQRAADTGIPDPAPVITACAIGAKQECAISRGEVLAIIIPDQEGTEK